MRLAQHIALAVTLVGSFAGCATTRIPNTDVVDSEENRELIAVAERYRHAVEQRDVRALLAMAAPNYFEDSGTPAGDDDYGIDGLRLLLSSWADSVREIRYECRYRRVTRTEDGNHASIDYTYTGSFTLVRPALVAPTGTVAPAESILRTDPAREPQSNLGPQDSWQRRVADNRLEVERVDGHWRIVAGM
ncbi:MAG: hypothetical protein Q8Q09_02120 [Deltaproteobacteria bacterium]|nr:hypothetical protein [Deltaproteobacteria bacterium]